MMSLFYHLKTLFLFTKSDIKTTVIPVSIFAAAAAPLASFERLPHLIFWVWLHVLQFDVSNQYLDPAEDAFNKPDRPIPSGRVTLRQTQLLRWALVPICMVLSACYSTPVVWSTVLLCLLTYTYNELHLHAGHWITRNLNNAFGFASFELGATFVAGADANKMDSVGMLAVAISTGIFATTIQTQDFKDCDGDRRIGRQTLPIVLPQLARYSLLPILLTWSMALSVIWDLSALVAVPFLGLALLVALRFITMRDMRSDQVSFYIYNIWLSAAHSLPGYWRSCHGF